MGPALRWDRDTVSHCGAGVGWEVSVLEGQERWPASGRLAVRGSQSTGCAVGPVSEADSLLWACCHCSREAGAGKDPSPVSCVGRCVSTHTLQPVPQLCRWGHVPRQGPGWTHPHMQRDRYESGPRGHQSSESPSCGSCLGRLACCPELLRVARGAEAPQLPGHPLCLLCYLAVPLHERAPESWNPHKR